MFLRLISDQLSPDFHAVSENGRLSSCHGGFLNVSSPCKFVKKSRRAVLQLRASRIMKSGRENLEYVEEDANSKKDGPSSDATAANTRGTFYHLSLCSCCAFDPFSECLSYTVQRKGFHLTDLVLLQLI